MGGTSTISGGKLCLRIDPRVPTLSGCAASRGPTIKANTVPFSWIMAIIHELPRKTLAASRIGSIHMR
jgi:hypothetical protein